MRQLDAEIQALLDSIKINIGKGTIELIKDTSNPTPIVVSKQASVKYKLADYWYNKLYTRNNKGWLATPSQVPLKDFFLQIANNLSPAFIDKKWVVRDNLLNGAYIHAHKAFIERRFNIYIPEIPIEPLKQGSFVSILENIGLEYFDDNSFTFFFGKLSPNEIDDTVRFYFNVDPSNKEYILFEFLQEAIIRLNEKKVVFMLKLLSSTQLFNRADSIVIYVEKRSLENCLSVIDSIYQILKTIIREEQNIYESVPMFTFPIKQGWGFAEEPINQNTNPSFGQTRMFDIAIPVINAICKKKTLPTVDFIKDYLANNRKKYDLDFFYLNPKSRLLQKEPKPYQGNPISIRYVSHNIYLCKAIQIGYYLAGQAILEKDKNNTIVAIWSKAISFPPSNEQTSKYLIKSCSEKLFDGTAGISLFFFSIYFYFPEQLFLNMGLASLQSSINIIQNEKFKHGFHKGTLGVLHVVQTILDRTKDASTKTTLEKHKDLLITIINEGLGIETNKPSIIEGYAGTILGVKKHRESNINNKKINFPNNALSILEQFLQNQNTLISELLIAYIKLPNFKKTIVEDALITENMLLMNGGFNNVDILQIAFARLGIHKDSIGINQKLLLPEYLLDILRMKGMKQIDYSLNGGFLGYYDLGLYYNTAKNAPIGHVFSDNEITVFIENINNTYLNHEQFPPFKFGHNFYNPGMDGLAGLGFFFLRLLDTTRVSSIMQYSK